MIPERDSKEPQQQQTLSARVAAEGSPDRDHADKGDHHDNQGLTMMFNYGGDGSHKYDDNENCLLNNVHRVHPLPPHARLPS